jgi:Cu(I)/Ag(I) efflux system membrane protein CusA/SilA
LREAVIEGALLRLRPKVMTVATVVASLLPVMWSSRPGTEVMQPIATPVIGGMLSSLLHVLVVTPVVYCLIHERRLRSQSASDVALPAAPPTPGRYRRAVLVAGGAVALAVAGLALWRFHDGRSPTANAPIVQVVRADGVELVLRSPSGALRTGRNELTLEFRVTGTGAPADAGRVRAAATMAMPGMAMSGGLAVQPTSEPGRYRMTAEFAMAGSWHFTVDWESTDGPRTVAFEGSVQ